MSQKCALCPAGAVVFCVNDDALLCAACDVAMHDSNPLLARHERRQLSPAACCGAGASDACGSEACGARSEASPAASDLDVAVVPQMPHFMEASDAEDDAAATAACTHLTVPAPTSAPCPPRTSFDVWRREFASDLLDIDLPPLIDPACAGLGQTDGDFASCELSDACVVPSAPLGGFPSRFCGGYSAGAASPMVRGGFGAAAAAQAGCHMVPVTATAPLAVSFGAPSCCPSSSFFSSASASTAAAAAAPLQLVPQTAVPAAAASPYAAAPPAAAQPYALELAQQQREREERLRRQRAAQQKRSKRGVLGRTVRYQSRKAYAMIRPRIKGRFVSPEEWDAYLAQQAASGAPADACFDGASPADSEGAAGEEEEDVHVVPCMASPGFAF